MLNQSLLSEKSTAAGQRGSYCITKPSPAGYPQPANDRLQIAWQ